MSSIKIAPVAVVAVVACCFVRFLLWSRECGKFLHDWVLDFCSILFEVYYLDGPSGGV